MCASEQAAAEWVLAIQSRPGKDPPFHVEYISQPDLAPECEEEEEAAAMRVLQAFVEDEEMEESVVNILV